MSANVIYNTDMNIVFVQLAHTTRRSIKKNYEDNIAVTYRINVVPTLI